MKPKILIVDDDPDVVDVLTDLLSLSGFEVLVAQTAEQFLRVAFSQKPRVIVLDIMLGRENGPLVYHDLLSKGFDRNIPVIFLSALATDQTPTFPKHGGTYALVGKPFDSDRLVREIENLAASSSN